MRSFRDWLILILMAGVLAPAHATVVPWSQAMLWQEHFLWDALLQSRSRAARQQADPNLIPVVQTITQQVAQQAANLKQIEEYTKSQQDNLRFAFSQKDPSKSLATIEGNIDTLSKGLHQIRNNLYFLTVRCRLASTQALPDPELTTAAAALIAQVQAVQLSLNTLYADALAVQAQVAAETWVRDPTLHYQTDLLVRSTIQVQNAVFAIYNSSYELHVRAR